MSAGAFPLVLARELSLWSESLDFSGSLRETEVGMAGRDSLDSVVGRSGLDVVGCNVCAGPEMFGV